jgi:hypothetical protein
VDFKKEFTKLNKDPEYPKELLKLSQDEERILREENVNLIELLAEVSGKLNECLEYPVQDFNQTEIYSDILHIHDFCEEHLKRITNA